MKKVFSQALISTENNINIIMVYAQYLEEQCDLEAAIKQWQNAIEAYPQNKDIYQAEITRLEEMIK